MDYCDWYEILTFFVNKIEWQNVDRIVKIREKMLRMVTEQFEIGIIFVVVFFEVYIRSCFRNRFW